MKMYVNGGWVESPVMSPVVSPYSREIVDTVPEATSEQVDQALAAAERATATMGQLTGYEHSQILNRAADLLAASLEDFARTISLGNFRLPVAETFGVKGAIRNASPLQLGGFAVTGTPCAAKIANEADR